MSVKQTSDNTVFVLKTNQIRYVARQPSGILPRCLVPWDYL